MVLYYTYYLNFKKFNAESKILKFTYSCFFRTVKTHSLFNGKSTWKKKTITNNFMYWRGAIATFEKRLVFSLVSVSPSLLFSAQPQNYFTHLSTTKLRSPWNTLLVKYTTTKLFYVHHPSLVFVDLICAFFWTFSWFG